MPSGYTSYYARYASVFNCPNFGDGVYEPGDKTSYGMSKIAGSGGQDIKPNVAHATRLTFQNPPNPLAETLVGRSIAASAELFERTTRRYGKPEFAITATQIDGSAVAVEELQIACEALALEGAEPGRPKLQKAQLRELDEKLQREVGAPLAVPFNPRDLRLAHTGEGARLSLDLWFEGESVRALGARFAPRRQPPQRQRGPR